MEVRRDRIPEVVDGFDLMGVVEHFGGYSYLAAVYVLAQKDLEPLAEGLHNLISGMSGALSSASASSSGLCAIRSLMIDTHALYSI